MATSNDDWKKVEMGGSWNYKEEGKGAEIVGVYILKKEHVGENNSNVYTLRTEDGDVNVWGSTVLDVRMERINIGEEVKIVYLGQIPSEKRKGKSYHAFDVYHRVTPFRKSEPEDVSQNDIDYVDEEMSR